MCFEKVSFRNTFCMRHLCILFLFCQIFSSIFNLIQKPISGIHHLVTYFASHRANFELFYHSTWNDEQQKNGSFDMEEQSKHVMMRWRLAQRCTMWQIHEKCSIFVPLLFCWFFEQLGFFPLFNMNNDIATQDWYKIFEIYSAKKLNKFSPIHTACSSMVWAWDTHFRIIDNAMCYVKRYNLVIT